MERLPRAASVVLKAVEEACSSQVDVVRGQRRRSAISHSMLIEGEALGQHQPPAMSKLVEEMEAVVGCYPPFYCEVGWSVVGSGCGMSSSYRDGCHVAV